MAGLITNEPMVNRWSYKKIQRGPNKDKISTGQRAYEKRAIDLLM